jgi:hypothetical protein
LKVNLLPSSKSRKENIGVSMKIDVIQTEENKVLL